jgi:hypothetical protein
MCYATDPSPQEQAENDCVHCKHEKECTCVNTRIHEDSNVTK